jgi:hypothetical protein
MCKFKPMSYFVLQNLYLAIYLKCISLQKCEMGRENLSIFMIFLEVIYNVNKQKLDQITYTKVSCIILTKIYYRNCIRFDQK